jgi:hypothetical protein
MKEEYEDEVQIKINRRLLFLNNNQSPDKSTVENSIKDQD